MSKTFWPTYEEHGPGPFVLVMKCGCIESMMLSSDRETATVMRPPFNQGFLYYGSYEDLKKREHVVGVRVDDMIFDKVTHAEEQRKQHQFCSEG